LVVLLRDTNVTETRSTEFLDWCSDYILSQSNGPVWPGVIVPEVGQGYLAQGSALSVRNPFVRASLAEVSGINGNGEMPSEPPDATF
jgi:hypothetical protein